MPPKAPQQFRTACFTLFVETTAPLDITTAINGIEHVKYYVYQFERTPNTNRLHAQGFMVFATGIRMRLNKIKREILKNDTAHVEGKYENSTSAQARDYCMKEATREPNTVPIEWGEFDGGVQGKRTDLDDAIADIQAGILEEDFRQTHPGVAARYVQYCNQLFTDRSSRSKNRPRDVRVECLWGDAGSGKTHKVFHTVTEEYGSWDQVYVLECTTPLWYDGYSGQPVILIDDFSSAWVTSGALSLPHFLRLLDIYPMRLNVKGRHTWMAATRIFITSNQSPDHWFAGISADQLAAVKRRIHKTHHMTGIYIAPAAVEGGDVAGD